MRVFWQGLLLFVKEESWHVLAGGTGISVPSPLSRTSAIRRGQVLHFVEFHIFGCSCLDSSINQVCEYVFLSAESFFVCFLAL